MSLQPGLVVTSPLKIRTLSMLNPKSWWPSLTQRNCTQMCLKVPLHFSRRCWAVTHGDYHLKKVDYKFFFKQEQYQMLPNMFFRARPTTKDCFTLAWLQDSYLMKLRRQTLTFTSSRLKEFLVEQQSRRTEEATKHKVLLRTYQSSPQSRASGTSPHVPSPKWGDSKEATLK